ncbi:MAG: hypothetical protein RLY13_771 [Actinomycetota bacterium]
MRPIVNRFSDAASVAKNAATDLAAKLTALLAENDQVHIQVTGGTVGIQTLSELSQLREFQNLELSRLHIWWGDERYVASDSDDRNAKQANTALFSKLQNQKPVLHEFPSTDSGLSLADAAEKFQEEFVALCPIFKIALVGMGPDGHICSLFPDKPAPAVDALVIAEHNSPKPPPQRLSFSYSAMNQVEEIWFVVAGADKQTAVAVAFGDDPQSLPVGRVRGTQKTVWYLDSTAGSAVFGC